MKRLWVLALVACGSTVAPVPPAPPPLRPVPAPVVAVDPPQPTLRLPHHFEPRSHAVHVEVDPAKPTFTGSIAIAGELAAPTHVFWLHGRNLTVASATATWSRSAVLAVTQRGDDLLELRATEPIPAGRVSLQIHYTGKVTTDGQTGVFASRFDKDAYLFTHMEPIEARRVFPCIDEPDRKVPWQITLDIPSALTAVSNAPLEKSSPLPDGRTRLQFASTRPLPSYLVSFAVGPFAIVDAGHSKSGVPVRIVTPRGTEARTRYAADATPKLIDVIETWFAMKFPYPKLDIVISPTYDDAMEDAGAILTGPDMLLDADRPSWAAKRGIAATIGHELAHQWFGDLVTPAWWDDLWLNESFATWMEDSITTWFEPAWNDEDLRVAVKHTALGSDALTTSRKIRAPIAQAGDVYTAFDNITYNKGASVLRMIERYIGPAEFRTGVQAFMKAHADGTATSKDLVTTLEATTHRSVGAILSSFLEQAGAPVLSMALACGPTTEVHVVQQRYVPLGAPAASPQTWTLPVCIAYEANGKRERTCAVIDKPAATIPLSSCPAWWTGNADGDGYYRIAVAASDVAALVKPAPWKALSNRERRTLLEDARSQTMVGKLPVASTMAIAKQLLASDDWQSIGDALGGVGRFGLSQMTGLPNDLEGVIPPALADRVRTRLRAEIGPRAVALGFVGAPGDDYNREWIRRAFVETAAHLQEPRLARKAIDLAARYQTLPSSTRGLVLRLAVGASPTLADKVLAAVLAEPDRERRLEMLSALAVNPDPTRRTRALDLALDPKLDINDLRGLVFAYGDANEREPIDRWLRAHMADLKKRLPPPTEIGIGAYLGSVFVGACDPARRDEIVKYVHDQFGGYVGNREPQQIEWMDQCIARQAAVGPSVQAWIGK